MDRVIRGWKTPNYKPPNDLTYKANGYGRRYAKVDGAFGLVEAFSAFGVDGVMEEPRFGCFIGNHYLDKTFVPAHTDPAPDGFVHVRANWMLKKPKQGGNPVIGGSEHEVGDGDLWLCFASEEMHATTPIFGGERVVLSFGALIERTKYLDIKRGFA